MVRFTKYGRYRHSNCIDTDIIIEKIQYLGPNYIKLKVYWVLQRNPEFIITDDRITIRKESYKHWREVAHGF